VVLRLSIVETVWTSKEVPVTLPLLWFLVYGCGSTQFGLVAQYAFLRHAGELRWGP